MSESPPAGARPRVLHFITHLALGGAERVALTLAKQMQETHEIGFFTVQPAPGDAVSQAMQAEVAALGCPIFAGTRLPVKFGGMALAGIAAAHAVRKFQPDVIHLHTEIPEAAYAAMVWIHPKLARIPTLRTIHNSVYWHYWPRLGAWCERRMGHAHIAGVSPDAVRAFIVHRQRAIGAPPATVPTLIYNGVAEPGASGGSRIANGALKVLFAGRFDEQKGTDLLPKIFGHLCDLRGELTIFGAGRHQALLAQFAARPPPGWSVTLFPPVPNLRTRMHEFDLIIMPSRYEGLSLLAIETLLAAVPLVLSDAPGLREIAPPDYPWIAPAGDAEGFARALRTAVTERARWSSVMPAAQASVRARFSVDEMTEQYRRVYSRAMHPAKLIPA